ncbi:MAG: HNH endonuclease [Clostridium lundense]|nr:HNH endonuclease [Clostridium lundense]
MAKEFSRSFYKSKEWKKAREYIYKKYNGLCNDCNKPGEEVHHKTFLTPENMNNHYITLGENNLVLLCRDCHHKRHRKNEHTREGLSFNEYGELVEG